MALGQFPIADDVVWQICGAIVLLASPALNWSLIYRLARLPNYAPWSGYLISNQIGLLLELSVLAAGFLGRVPLASAYGLALLIELASAGGMFLRVVTSITSARDRPSA